VANAAVITAAVFRVRGVFAMAVPSSPPEAGTDCENRNRHENGSEWGHLRQPGVDGTPLQWRQGDEAALDC
jgi:hypothetical protein